MKVQVLYFEGCPHHRPTIDLVKQVMGERGMPAEVEETEIRDQSEAERLRFLGSPSVRVKGVDIEPGAATRTEFVLGCRMYGASGVPPRELLVAALQRSD
jgi:hypothetical protein